MILSIIISNKIANYCGFEYDNSIPINLNNILEFLLSGQVLLPLIFGTIGYVILDYFVSFWAYILSSIWSDKIYDYDNHIKNLKEFSVIKTEDEKIIKGKNYTHFKEIVDNLQFITSIARSICSIIIFSTFCLISYGIGNIGLYVFLLIFSLNSFINLVFITVKSRQINYNNTELIQFIDNEPNPAT